MKIFITNISPQNAVFLHRHPHNGKLKFSDPLLSGEQFELGDMPKEIFEEIRKQFIRLPILSLEEYQSLENETCIFIFSADEPLSERTISQLMESHLSRRANLAVTLREAKIKSVIGEMIAESKKEGIFDEKAIDDYSFELLTIANKGGQATASLTEKYQLPEDKRI
ncbi:hypothetical protein FAI41_06150 [Acetobacteraceae bacterium]|nr:hypothetical protein FAI41_06150 [Acetobacteraceae bacterium]